MTSVLKSVHRDDARAMPSHLVNQAIEASHTYQTKTARVEELQINLKAVGQYLLQEGQRNIQEGQRKVAEAYRGMLINALGLMIFSASGTAIKAKEIVDESLRKYESQSPSDLFVFKEGKCMRMTPPVATIILDVLKKCPCAPNLTKFQDEIDPEAIKSVLADRNITKVIFARSAQESEAVKVAQEIARRRTLEIAFA